MKKSNLFWKLPIVFTLSLFLHFHVALAGDFELTVEQKDHDAATITGDDGNTTDGTQAITITGAGIAETSVAGSTVTVTATEVDPVVGAITGIPISDGAGNISAANPGTDYLEPTGDGSGLSNVVTAEVDPIVGAVSGIVMSDGAGNIGAAVAGTDYQAPLVAGTDFQVPLTDPIDDRASPGTIGGVSPGRGTFSPLTGQAPTAVSAGFAGTVSSSGTTLTFTEAADDALVEPGSIVVAGGTPLYVTKDAGALQWTTSASSSLGAGTAITSVVGPSLTLETPAGLSSWMFFSDGTAMLVDVSTGGVLNTVAADGSVGIEGDATVDGTLTAGTARVEVTGTGSLSDAQVMNTAVTNYNMASGGDTTLPAYSGTTMFTAITEAASQAWSFKPPSGEFFVLDGVALDADDEIDVGQNAGDKLTFVRIRTGASSYQWHAHTVYGTHVDGGAS